MRLRVPSVRRAKCRACAFAHALLGLSLALVYCCTPQARAREMLLCDGCDHGFHLFCLDPPLMDAPLAAWYCPACLAEQVR